MGDRTNELRQWATDEGMPGIEAAVELLARRGHDLLEDSQPWVQPDPYVGDQLRLDNSRMEPDHAQHLAPADQAVVAIARSLNEGGPVDLGHELSRLDPDGVRLVLAATAHASAAHKVTTATREGTGIRLHHQVGESLYPWPEKSGEKAGGSAYAACFPGGSEVTPPAPGSDTRPARITGAGVDTQRGRD